MEKQPFLGGVIAGKVIEVVVGKALDRVAKSPSLSLEPKDVPAVKQIVAESVKTELAKRDDFASNREPVYRSPVTIGSAMTLLSAVVGIYNLWTGGAPIGEEYYPHVTIILGSLFALWGRWFAKRPLGA